MVGRVTQVKSFLLPSWGELTLEFFAGLICLTLLKLSALWHLVVGSQNIPTTDNPVLNRLNTALATPAVWLFWLFVGCLCYMVVWLFISFALTVHEDVEGASYVMPKGSQNKYWKVIGSNSLFLAASAIGVIGYLVVTLRLLAGLSDIFYTGFAQLTVQDLLQSLIAIVATTLLIYVLARLVRLAVYAFKITLVRNI